MAEAIDKAELAYWLARICPEEATDETSLDTASKLAAESVANETPAIAERVKRSLSLKVSPWVYKEELAREVAKRGRQLRNDWLKEHGAYARG